MNRLVSVMLSIILIAYSFQSGQAGSLSVRAGFGYDYFSQSFQIDSLLTDSLDTNLRLSDTYFDDYKGKLQLEYAPGASRSMLLLSRFEQSADDFRFRGNFRINSKIGQWQFVSTQQLDTRKDQQVLDSIDNSYRHFSSRNLIYYKIGSNSKLKGELSGDFVSFSQTSQYRRDYSRLGGKLGFTAGFGAYSSYSIDLFNYYRNVPDSLAWNYNNSGVDVSLFWLRTKGETDILVRWELKDYDQPGGQDDFKRFDFQLKNSHSSDNSLIIKELVGFETVSFAADSFYNYDYNKIEIAALIGFSKLSSTLLIGPAGEWLIEGDIQAEGALLGFENYQEIGLQAEFDYMNYQYGFYSLNASIGRRTHEAEDPIESDFRFTRLDLLLDIPIISELKASIIFSSEWEYHDNQSENNRIILFSGSLNYTF